jgi:hypothetical protein
MNKTLVLDYMTLDQIENALRTSTDPLKLSYLGLYRGLATGDVPSTDWADEFGMTPTPLGVCLERMWAADRTASSSSNLHRSLS